MKSCVLIIENNIEEQFIKERDSLKNMIYEELDSLEKAGKQDSNRMSMLLDSLYVMEKGFEDLLKGLSYDNLTDRQRRLEIFKESLLFALE